ncbi:anaerobic ribonucleoside-triphosphate reductase activating protein [Alcaligenes faecalis]|nr:anaerobic ribonucleoside-triphosphate reductase activating protein [Alcaligenes faecalis]
MTYATRPPYPKTNTHKVTLKVGGCAPFSATDYPGKLAAVIFVQGCPWRCGYCHNPHLQERTTDSAIDWDDLMVFLNRRVGLLDAVVFSGGEPTLDPALGSAIQAVRKLGFKIGLHTAGTHPARLQAILPWLDWIGLDIKAEFSQYDAITQRSKSAAAPLRSLQLLLNEEVLFECRSTLHPQLHSPASIQALGQHLHKLGVQRYAVQIFRTQGCEDNFLNETGQALEAYPGAEVLETLQKLFPHFEVRRS